MKPVEKVLSGLEGVVESEGVVRFRIALEKSEKSEVSVLTKNLRTRHAEVPGK